MASQPQINIKALFTDLDNTLYNWVDYFAPSFRAMVHALSKAMSISEDTLYENFQEVYAIHGSLEYAYSVQELKVCVGLAESEIARLVRIARYAFTAVRKTRLEPYAGVEDTLSWLSRNGILVIGITDAPFFHAQRRLSTLKLDKYFYGLAAWNQIDTPQEFPWVQEIKMREAQGKYRSLVKKDWRLDRHELKPSPKGYKRVVESLGLKPCETCAVGDSIAKDLAPPMHLGAYGVWAKYGTPFDQRNFDTLLRITNWSKSKIAAAYDDKSIQPTCTIGDFRDLQDIVLPSQMNLLNM